MTTTETLLKIITLLQTELPGCVPVSVGGSVRDALLCGDGNDIEENLKHGKDYDLEIFGVKPIFVQEVLSKASIPTELVGLAFPVYKVKGHAIDISFPRKETCVGSGHSDYVFDFDPNMTFAEAAERRDFTVNAIGYNWNTKQLQDPYGGLADLSKKLLRPVSNKFQEDALRVLRTFKFIARYGLSPSLATMVFCQKMVYRLRGFAKERLVGEWTDFVLKADARFAEYALQFLIDCGAYELYPELFMQQEVEQEPKHHPEGNVYIHTVHCFKEFCNIRSALPPEDRLVVGLAVLCHDMGKISATHKDVAGKITAYGHETTSHTRMFLERLFHPADQIIVEVEALVRCHMRPYSLFRDQAGLSAFRRLNVDLEGRLDRLMQVFWCDQCGRPANSTTGTAAIAPNIEALSWFKAQVDQLNVKPTEKIQPIVKGRHIIEHLKLAPGPRVGELVKLMFEAQLDGKFENEVSGIAYLKANFQN